MCLGISRYIHLTVNTRDARENNPLTLILRLRSALKARLPARALATAGSNVCMRANGFMLFELLVVMAIVALCCAIGFMTYSPLKSGSFACDIALISLLFHTAATRAVALKTEQELIFDDQDSSLYFDGQKYKLHEPFVFGVLPDIYGPPSAPTKLVTQPITFINKKARIYKDGTVQSGTLYIKDGENQYAITTPVSAFTHIRAYRYTKKSWSQIY